MQMRSRALHLLICTTLIIFALTFTTLSPARPALAQGEVSIQISGGTVHCNSVSVTYNITDSLGPRSMGAHYTVLVNGAPSGNSSTSVQSGQSHTATVNINPPAPAGSNIMLTIRLTIGENTLAQAEYVGGQCNSIPPPPEEPPPPPQDPPPGGENWPGDNRLNPNRAEDYTVYCQNDQILVWGMVSVTTQEPQAIIAIRDVMNLPVGGFLLQYTLAIRRLSQDEITITGANGYRAPASGTKSFSLSECIARNGGEPPAPDVPNPPPDGDDSSNSVISDFENCLALGFRDFDECIEQSADTGLELLWELIYNCFPSLFIVISGPPAIWYKFRRKPRP